MRLIDADELKEGLRGNFKDVMGNFVFNTTFTQLEAIIDTAPTVKVLSKRPQGEIIKELWNCRNELCLRCGKYEKAYCGACDDCRYNSENMKRWRKDSE